MAKFIKGQSGNSKGRPEGTPNLVTNEMRELLNGIVAKELKFIPGILEKMDPEKRVELVIKLMPYVIPKVEAIPLPEPKKTIKISFTGGESK